MVIVDRSGLRCHGTTCAKAKPDATPLTNSRTFWIRDAKLLSAVDDSCCRDDTITSKFNVLFLTNKIAVSGNTLFCLGRLSRDEVFKVPLCLNTV